MAKEAKFIEDPDLAFLQYLDYKDLKTKNFNSLHKTTFMVL